MPCEDQRFMPIAAGWKSAHVLAQICRSDFNNTGMVRNIYGIIHIWTAVVDESEGWSSQQIFQFKHWKEEAGYGQSDVY